MKYTKEVLEEAVPKVKSYRELMQLFGLKITGGSQSNLVKRIKLYKISTNHFADYRKMLDMSRGWNKRTYNEILTKKNKGSKESAKNLRKALIESGRKYVCEECGQLPEWNGKQLIIQVHHLDGDNLNNQANNLRFLCPNCHTQTENFGNTVRGGMAYTAE